MKYFAKLLTIKGKIDSSWDGNWVRDKKGEYGTFILSHDIRAIMTLEEAQERLEKVKLFLCSRDIQVGDKVRFSHQKRSLEKELTVRKLEKDTVVLVDGKYMIHTNSDELVYKVVGEISPEATWVKEGDVFDENSWGAKANSNPTIIEIKGPCGHFH